jgi:hypothetical protein
MDTARSYPPARRGFASTWRRALDLVWVSGKGDPSLLAERCRAAYSDSLRADSTYLQARADLALFHARLASVLARQGGDPFPDLALAQDAANAALGLDSEHTHSLRAAFFAFIQNASLKLEFGQDPRPDLEAGLHWGEALRGLQPGNQTILKDLGLSSCMLGRFLSVWDLEAEPSFRKAETLCREAADKRPAPLFHQVHGDVLVYSAEHEIARGGDGAKVLEQALAAYGKGLAQTPDNPGLLLGAAKAWSLLGTLRAKTGEDPSPDWNRAEEALGKVLEKNKQWVEALEGMADLGLRRAEAAPRPGHPVAKTLATALDFAVQASRAQPRGCTALLLQARIQLLDVPGRRRPAAAFGTALTLLQQAAKRAPMDPRPRLELARLVQERLKPGPSTGDPAALRKLALDALQEITAVNPRHRAALKLRGALGG